MLKDLYQELKRLRESLTLDRRSEYNNTHSRLNLQNVDGTHAEPLIGGWEAGSLQVRAAEPLIGGWEAGGLQVSAASHPAAPGGSLVEAR